MRRQRGPLHVTLPATFWRDAFRAWEVGITAPQVIALRCLQMSAAGSRPGRRDRDELFRMGAEKVHTFGEVWAAMAMEAWLYPLKIGAALARSVPYGDAAIPMLNTFGRAVAPVHRRVRANVKRLSRPRKARRG